MYKVWKLPWINACAVVFAAVGLYATASNIHSLNFSDVVLALLISLALLVVGLRPYFADELRIARGTMELPEMGALYLRAWKKLWSEKWLLWVFGAIALVNAVGGVTYKLAREINVPDRVTTLFLDAGDEESSKSAVAKTLESFGRLDIMVSAIYLTLGKRVEDLTWADFDSMMHTNLTGTFFLAREAADAMTDGGSIVLFSSMFGLVAPRLSNYPPPMNPNPIDYGVAKAGIIQMAKYLAVYWAQRNIRVNCVAPGPFPHPKTQADEPEFTRNLDRSAPLGRIGRQEEVAGAVIFLASDDSSYITGQTLQIDGGWTIW